MSEGCSACACGIQGACDKLYMPDYALPGAIIAGAVLIILFVLTKMGVIKIRFRLLLSVWLAAALIFAVVVRAHTETEGDRTARRAEFCQTSGAPNCEY